MRGLYHDKSVPKVPNLVKTSSKPKISSSIQVSEKRNDENSESVIDVMDSLIRMFEPEYKPEEEVNPIENFSISNELQLGEPKTNKKRKRSDISRNVEGKYQCQECDYKASQSINLRTHVEAIHEGVRYSCDQCGYKATTAGNLKTHIDSIHRGITL